MNACGLRCGTAAQPLAVKRDMARRLPTTDPMAQRALQGRDIQGLEHLAPDRRRRNPSATDPNARQCVPAQPSAPAHDPQLVAPTRQHRCHGNQQQTGERIALALGTPVIRHRRQRMP
jgi:hypothetical protein